MVLLVWNKYNNSWKGESNTIRCYEWRKDAFRSHETFYLQKWGSLYIFLQEFAI